MGTRDLHSLHYFSPAFDMLVSFLYHRTNIFNLSRIHEYLSKGKQQWGQWRELAEVLRYGGGRGAIDTAQNTVHWCERRYCPLGVRQGKISCGSGRLCLQLQHQKLVLQQKTAAFSRDSLITVLIRCTIKIKRKQCYCCHVLNVCVGVLYVNVRGTKGQTYC